MAKQWYVVHTYSGYENRAKLGMEQRIKELGKEEFFGEVLVPSEKVVEVVGQDEPVATDVGFREPELAALLRRHRGDGLVGCRARRRLLPRALVR